MHFRIESTNHDNPVPAQTPEELGERLTAALDHWVKTTPQLTDATAAKAHDLLEETRVAGVGKPEVASAFLKGAVDNWKRAVENSSANLDETHTEIVSIARALIPAAVALAQSVGKPIRVSIHGTVHPVSADGLYPSGAPRTGGSLDWSLAKH